MLIITRSTRWSTVRPTGRSTTGSPSPTIIPTATTKIAGSSSPTVIPTAKSPIAGTRHLYSFMDCSTRWARFKWVIPTTPTQATGGISAWSNRGITFTRGHYLNLCIITCWVRIIIAIATRVIKVKVTFCDIIKFCDIIILCVAIWLVVSLKTVTWLVVMLSAWIRLVVVIVTILSL